MTVTVITPTGGRQTTLTQLEKYLLRQTIKPTQWIVIDDCLPRSIITENEATLIHPLKVWQEGEMSLTRNLFIGLNNVSRDSKYVVIMEDDDWYAPNHIETIINQLDESYVHLAGEGCARYYNVKSNRYIIHDNMNHSSLCQTGFMASAIDEIRSTILDNMTDKFIDIKIWNNPNLLKNIYKPINDKPTCIGIKGMPGRGGLGYGHKDNRGTVDETDLGKLKEWIGDEDYLFYLNNRN